MKKLFLLLVFFLFTQNMHAQKSPKKIALIVTIDNYPLYHKITNPGGWEGRTWANNDMSALWKLFRIRQKFDIVDTLKESNATRRNIMDSLDKLALKVAKGDIVVFCFAGHGQQVYDYKDLNNGLYEDEADGYDEALVPYDAQSLYSENKYKGENHIRDEELAVKLNAVRAKLGNTGSLLVLVDACHSGTITKSVEDHTSFRGSRNKIEPSGYKPPPKLNEQSFIIDKANSAPGLAPIVVMSGSAQDQINYPVKFKNSNEWIGALTNAFIKAIENFKEPVNYKVLFESIYQTITRKHTNHTPLIEGADSIAVLGNRVLRLDDFISVTPVKEKMDSAHLLNHGLMHDIKAGMEFFVYPLGETVFDTSKAVTKGVISISDPFSSAARLKKRLNEDSSYIAVFSSRAYGDFGCSIEVKGNTPLINRIRDSLNRYKNFSQVTAESDMEIKQFTNAKTRMNTIAAIRSRKGNPLFDTLWKKNYKVESEIDGQVLATLLSRIRLFSRAQFLRSLSMPENDMNLKEVIVRVIPVEAAIGWHEGAFFPKEIKRLSRDSMMKKSPYMNIRGVNSYSPQDGFDGFKIEVINKSKKAVYLTVLQIDPEDSIFIRAPHKRCKDCEIDANEFRIGPDSTMIPLLPKILTFWELEGREYVQHLKILISDGELNLEGLSTKKHAASTSLDDFLNEALDDNAFINKITNREVLIAPNILKPVRPESMKILSVPFRLVRSK